MKNKMLKVEIANPSRQYSHQLALALQQGGMLSNYYTMIWYNRKVFPYNLAPDRLAYKINDLFKNSSYDALDPKKIKQFPYLGLAHWIISKLIKDQFKQNQLYHNLIFKTFDCLVASNLKQTKPDLFIGYEAGCKDSFKVCKLLKTLCILDLADVHWALQNNLFLRESNINHHFKPSFSHLARLCKAKQAELELADFILVLSSLAKKSLLDVGIDPSKIFLIPLGIDSSIFVPKMYYKHNSNFTILYVGQIAVKKGIHYLLKAHKELNIKDSRLLIIGPLINKDLLKPYDGYFHYIPTADHISLSKYYREADIIVIPSLFDGFNQVACEAMASGTPVIVTENVGAKDFVQDGKNGFIVPAQDHNALKEKILFFYENRNLLEKFGRNSAISVKDLTWDNYRKKIREIVTKIIINHKK